MVILIILILIEVLFRVFYYLKYKRPYHVSLKFPWGDNHVVTHPFLSFSYKRNGIINKNQRLPYPLHTNKFFSYKNPLKLNNLGHFGKNITEKTNKIRVLCLGASTTANNIADKHRDYNYPDLLQSKLGDKYEVINCGIGGWTSIDILINFQLNLLKLKPDYVILYHGYNDLQYHLMEDFVNDYSHGRMNLGNVLHKIKLAYYLPKIKFWHSYEFIKDKLFGTGNVRNDVLGLINSKPVNYFKEFSTLNIEKEILENIFILCKYHKIKLITSSFCFYNYKNDLISNKLLQGVKQENQNLEDLAKKYKTIFVDQYNLIPQKEEYFVDSVHFTPKGMDELANNFNKKIK
jgi:lysophospholipase L1-like esterase|tara:strand:+ start:603 stop:1643 length:1041 start_codon:yes stop_codon:yes gene_type:complete